MEKLDDHKAAVDAMRKDVNPRSSGLLLALRFHFHVWNQTCEDRDQAHRKYERRRDAISDVGERAT